MFLPSHTHHVFTGFLRVLLHRTDQDKEYIYDTRGPDDRLMIWNLLQKQHRMLNSRLIKALDSDLDSSWFIEGFSGFVKELDHVFLETPSFFFLYNCREFQLLLPLCFLFSLSREKQKRIRSRGKTRLFNWFLSLSEYLQAQWYLALVYTGLCVSWLAVSWR